MMIKRKKHILAYLALCIFVLMFLVDGLYAIEGDVRLIEEDLFLWDKLSNDPALLNKNELYSAHVAYSEGFYSVAIDTFNSCIAHNLSNEAVKAISEYYIGRMLFIYGEYNEAVNRLQSASGRDLGEYSNIKSAILLDTALSYYKLNMISEYKAILNEVIKNPSEEKYRKIAMALFQSQDKQAAVEDTRKPVMAEEKKAEDKKNKYMMIGVNLGEIFIMGKWGDIYDNSVYINPFFLYIFTENAGMSVNIDYFSTDVKSSDLTYYSSLVLLGGTLGIFFNLDLTETYGLSFSIGAGLARTVETIPVMNSAGQMKKTGFTSYDPYLNMSLSFNYNYNNFQFTAGVSSKTIYYYYFEDMQYQNEDLDMIGLFMGVSVKN